MLNKREEQKIDKNGQKIPELYYYTLLYTVIQWLCIITGLIRP